MPRPRVSNSELEGLARDHEQHSRQRKNQNATKGERRAQKKMTRQLKQLATQAKRDALTEIKRTTSKLKDKLEERLTTDDGRDLSLLAQQVAAQLRDLRWNESSPRKATASSTRRVSAYVGVPITPTRFKTLERPLFSPLSSQPPSFRDGLFAKSGAASPEVPRMSRTTHDDGAVENLQGHHSRPSPTDDSAISTHTEEDAHNASNLAKPDSQPLILPATIITITRPSPPPSSPPSPSAPHIDPVRTLSTTHILPALAILESELTPPEMQSYLLAWNAYHAHGISPLRFQNGVLALLEGTRAKKAHLHVVKELVGLRRILGLGEGGAY